MPPPEWLLMMLCSTCYSTDHTLTNNTHFHLPQSLSSSSSSTTNTSTRCTLTRAPHVYCCTCLHQFKPSHSSKHTTAQSATRNQTEQWGRGAVLCRKVQKRSKSYVSRQRTRMFCPAVCLSVCPSVCPCSVNLLLIPVHRTLV